MIVRVLPRQGGKTTEMIRLAADGFLYIVCPDKRQVDSVWAEAKRLGLDIPFPLTWAEFCGRRYYGWGVVGVVIDNLDMCVQSMSAVPVRAITMTDDAAQAMTAGECRERWGCCAQGGTCCCREPRGRLPLLCQCPHKRAAGAVASADDPQAPSGLESR